MGAWLFSGQNLRIFGSDVISPPDLDTDLLVVENLCNVRIIGSTLIAKLIFSNIYVHVLIKFDVMKNYDEV